MRIALTTRFCDYVADGCEWVFEPVIWCIQCDDDECSTLSWELTDDGYDLADQYKDDASHGYDLCYGRCKGLADQYTEMQMFEKIVTDARYVKSPVNPRYFNIYEAVECLPDYSPRYEEETA